MITQIRIFHKSLTYTHTLTYLHIINCFVIFRTSLRNYGSSGNLQLLLSSDFKVCIIIVLYYSTVCNVIDTMVTHTISYKVPKTVPKTHFNKFILHACIFFFDLGGFFYKSSKMVNKLINNRK